MEVCKNLTSSRSADMAVGKRIGQIAIRDKASNRTDMLAALNLRLGQIAAPDHRPGKRQVIFGNGGVYLVFGQNNAGWKNASIRQEQRPRHHVVRVLREFPAFLPRPYEDQYAGPRPRAD